MEHGLVPATGKARRTGLYPRVWRRAKINESKRKWAEHFSFWPTVRKIRGWSARVICVRSNKKKGGGKGRKKEERILLLQRCTDFWMKNRWIENERFQEVDNEAWSFLGCTCDRIRIVKRCSDSGRGRVSSSCVEATFLESETCVIDDGIENFFGEGYCVISGRGKIRRID